MSHYKTEQENFWAEAFGNEYIGRNKGEQLITKNIALWSNVLFRLPDIKSILELGCNIGLNLQALNRINPDFDLVGYEINKKAASKCAKLDIARVENKSILEPIAEDNRFDLTFTKGVLIHIHPDHLGDVYDNLYNLSNRYILVCEYYNPTPVMVNYRGHQNRLFKRDFAGEIIDKYHAKLIDYGFVYHRDNNFPQDDFNWFLLEK